MVIKFDKSNMSNLTMRLKVWTTLLMKAPNIMTKFDQSNTSNMAMRLKEMNNNINESSKQLNLIKVT